MRAGAEPPDSMIEAAGAGLSLGINGAMRVLLRDTRTGDYFAKEMRWVRNPEGAAEFETVEAAGWGARECGRRDAIIVLRYEKPECELGLDPVVCVTDAGGGGPGLRT